MARCIRGAQLPHKTTTLKELRTRWYLQVHDQMRKALSQDLRRYQGVPRKPGHSWPKLTALTLRCMCKE
eukprot:526224-Amphidinium_carterae.3